MIVSNNVLYFKDLGSNLEQLVHVDNSFCISIGASVIRGYLFYLKHVHQI
jgi:hypothetical protein